MRKFTEEQQLKKDRILWKQLYDYMSSCIKSVSGSKGFSAWCKVRNGIVFDMEIRQGQAINSQYAKNVHFTSHKDKGLFIDIVSLGPGQIISNIAIYKGLLVEELLASEEMKAKLFEKIVKVINDMKEDELQEQKDKMLCELLKSYISACSGLTLDELNIICKVKRGLAFFMIGCKTEKGWANLKKYNGQAVEELLESEEFGNLIKFFTIIQL